MNRAQLVEMLEVERFQPRPPTPKPGLVVSGMQVEVPVDGPKAQYARRTILLAELDAFEKKPAPIRLVKQGPIFVGERAA